MARIFITGSTDAWAVPLRERSSTTGIRSFFMRDLAVSDDPAATVSGGYWYHRQPQTPVKAVEDPAFQDHLSAKLAELTGVTLF